MHGKHRKRRKRIILFAILGFFIIVVTGSVLSVQLHRRKNAVLYDEPEKMVVTAQRLYKQGRLDQAVEQLAYYCQYYAQGDAADCFLELGDWYTQKGEPENASYSYNRAMAIQYPNLKRTTVADTGGASFRLRIEPLIGFTKKVYILANAENMISMSKSVRGIISPSGKLKESLDYRTSNWFPIPENMHTLLLTGEFNCAIWEFQNKAGYYSVVETGEIDLHCRSYVTVKVPEDTIKCRVTYRQSENGEYIEGKAYVFCADPMLGYSGSDNLLINLPDLQKDQFLLYGDEIWTLWQNNRLLSRLDLPVIPFDATQTVIFLGDICGDYSITIESEKQNKHNWTDRQ